MSAPLSLPTNARAARLTERQIRFVRECVANPDGDTTAAAIRAGYPKGSARVSAWRNLRNSGVQAALTERRDALELRSGWTAVRVINELANLADEAQRAGNFGVARDCYRDIGEHLGMWPRQPVNVDARTQVLTLPDGLDEDTLRALAAMPVARTSSDEDDDAPE